MTQIVPATLYWMLSCARQNTKHFVSIVLFNPQSSYSHFTDEQLRLRESKWFPPSSHKLAGGRTGIWTKSDSKDFFSYYNLLPLRWEPNASDSSPRDLSKLFQFEVSWEATCMNYYFKIFLLTSSKGEKSKGLLSSIPTVAKDKK